MFVFREMAALFHSSAVHASRTKQRNSFLSQGLPHIRNKTVSEARANLEDKISRSISSAKVSSYESLLCLLDELTVKNCLPFHVAFDEYAAKLENKASPLRKSTLFYPYFFNILHPI